MTDISIKGAGETSVFCQITGREIGPESCSRTQGQAGCFGCAASTRICEECNKNFVVVAATGTCSECTTRLVKAEKRTAGLKQDWPNQIKCQSLKRSITWTMCRGLEGQESCRGCASPYRTCENCKEKPVRFPLYGLCFGCTVQQLGEGWESGMPDRPVATPHLQVVTNVSSTEPGGEVAGIQTIARDFRRVPLNQIREPELLLREVQEDDELDSLGESMLNDGMIYPVILEQVEEDTFEVVIGSRRVRAAKHQEALDIPAFIFEPQSPLTKLILMLAENLHRVDLDPFEEGRVFLRLMREYSLGTTEVAERVRRPTSYVTERVQLLSLPTEIQQLVANRVLAFKKAVLLARLPSEELQTVFAQESVAHALEPAELRRRISMELGTTRDSSRATSTNVTFPKLTAKVEGYTVWLKGVQNRLDSESASPKNRQMAIKALDNLWLQVKEMRQHIEPPVLPSHSIRPTRGDGRRKRWSSS